MDGPRERLHTLGPEALSDTELLAVVLGSGRVGHPVMAVATQLLVQGGGIVGLSRRSPIELERLEGLGPAKAARLVAAFELGLRAQRPLDPAAPLNDSRAVFARYGPALSGQPTERFWVVAVDAKNRPLTAREVARGGRTACQVEPAEVFRVLVREAANAAILLHNHPSGDPSPSPEDLALTERLVRAGDLLRIRVLDHLVVGRGRYTSLRDAGLWPTLPSNSST